MAGVMWVLVNLMVMSTGLISSAIELRFKAVSTTK